MSRRSVVLHLLALVLVPTLAYTAGRTKDDVTGFLFARRFEVVDKEGRVRASLEAEKQGRAQLVLRDRAGRVRATFGVGDTREPALEMQDEKGIGRAVVTFTEQTGAVVQVADAQGSVRCFFVVPTAGDKSNALILADGSSAIRAALAVDAKDQPMLSLYNARGETPLAFLVDETGAPMGMMLDHGRPVWAEGAEAGTGGEAPAP